MTGRSAGLIWKGAFPMKAWKFGISAAPEAPNSAPILLTGPICDCLRKAAELGYDAIEYHTREHAEFDYDEIRRTMEDTGCRISMIVTGRLYTQGGFSLTSEDPENEQAAVEGMLKYIRMAAEVGAGLVIGWAKGKISDAASREVYFARLTKNLQILDAAAAEAKVPIVIEVINHYEVDAFLTAAELAAYLKAQNFHSIYAHLDTYHMELEEEDYPAAIRAVGQQLGYVHFADSTRWYPGSGYMEFAPILKALDEVGYEGYLTIECVPRTDRYETARKGLAHLKAIAEAI